MYLEVHEVERFYNIWFPLLHYVNQKQQLVPFFPAKWDSGSVEPEVAVMLRNALWADSSLLESFILDNPAGLSADDLSLVRSWQYRVAGEFFIFRYLKKYTVFLSGEVTERAYGVLGLMDPIEEVMGPYLPIYVQAALIPFGGRIIYDGLLSSYPVYFGGGIRSGLQDSYRNIQEREGIVTTLVPDPEASSPENIKKGIRGRNKKILRAFQKHLGRSGLSPKMIKAHTENIADFSQEFLLSLNPPSGLLDITLADLKAYLEIQAGKANVVSFRRFARFLRDTGRIDFDEVEDLLYFLKSQ